MSVLKSYVILDDQNRWQSTGKDCTPEQIADDIKAVYQRLKDDGETDVDLVLFETIGEPLNIKQPKDKPKLNATETIAKTIDYHDFEDFVQQCYGGNFEFVAVHEANNYSQYEFNAEKIADENNIVHKDTYKKIRSGKYPDYSVPQIFDCLCQDGFIEAGKYIVKVSW